MADTLDAGLARRLWHAAEPLHAVVYFAQETAQAARDAGLKGFWMGYFAGRAAPMGPVSPAVVTATFFNFHPAMVGRAIPDAWSFAAPAAVLQTRLDAVTRALARLLGPADESGEVAEAARLAAAACEGLDHGGRPLAAAWGGVARPDEPLAALWLACTVLREHRGDGHVSALVDAGIDGCQAHVLAAASGGTSRETLQPNRGWSDADWAGAETRLTERGWLDASGRLTDAGREVRRLVEHRTDELALPPLRALGAERAARLIDLLEPLAARVHAAEAVPFPNPIGLPRPSRGTSA